MLSDRTLWKIVAFIPAILMILMVYQCAYLCAFETAKDDLPVTIINISVNCIGTIITLFIYVATYFDKWLRGKAQNIFLALTFYECLTLNSTLVICYVDGNPEMIAVNQIANLFYFGASIMMPFLLWLYVLYQKDDSSKGLLHRFVLCSFLCGALMLILNLFFGFIYYFDDFGMYQRTDAIWLSFLFPLIMVICIVYYSSKNLKLRSERFTLSVFLILTSVFGIIQMTNVEFQVMYIGVLFSLLAVYCNIYVRRGYELAKKDAEIDIERKTALVSQIRPHFLYNVLNTIMSMEDVDSMRKSVVTFGKYLRGNLDILSLNSTVPFTKELDHVKTYVSLEKIRYEERLTIKYEITAIDFEVPPLCVQVLAENAIKHGISKREDGGLLIIRSYSDEYYNYIEVNDSGVGFDTNKPLSEERSHIGVGNARSRLSSMVGGSLAIRSIPEVGTYAVITIPKKAQSFDSTYPQVIE